MDLDSRDVNKRLDLMEGDDESEIDEWFLSIHELPPNRAAADEQFFADLEKRDEMKSNKGNLDKENSSSVRNQTRNSMLTGTAAKRKRSITDRSITPNSRPGSSLATRAVKSTAISSSFNTTAAINPLKRYQSPSGVKQSTECNPLRSKTPTKTNSSSGFTESVSQKSLAQKRSSAIGLASQASKRLSTSNSQILPSSSSTIPNASSAVSSSLRSRSKPAVPNSTSATQKTKCPSSSAAVCSSGSNNQQTDLEKSLEMLLKEHNAKFAPVPVYEPPKHSVRDVRKWEKMSGRLWSDLKPEEREKVNEEIGQMKAKSLI